MLQIFTRGGGLLQSLIKRENVHVALVEQCEGCLGISPVTAQGMKSGTALLLGDKCKLRESL